MFKRGLRYAALFSLSATASFLYSSVKDADSPMYPHVFMPILQRLDAEDAHNLSKLMLKWGLGPVDKTLLKKNVNSLTPPPMVNLNTQVLGQYFENPIGLAAGFDKDSECMEAIENLGFGFMEVGSVCPKPQEGNPKPRIFRVKSKVSDVDEQVFDTIINRCGFNSKGIEVTEEHLKAYREKRKNTNSSFHVGVNLGKNKTSPPESIEDYLTGVKRLAKYADFMVINVSSPNTQHLRSLQEKDSLDGLLEQVSVELRKESSRRIPLLVKIAPDLTLDQQRDIANLVLKHKIDGIIVSNTTVERPFVSQSQLDSIPNSNMGGLSGRPLFPKSTKVLRNMYKLTDGKVTLIGVGGVWDGYDALQKIEAGASLVQVYTAFTAQGPQVVGRIKRELSQLLKERGYKGVSDAVGAKAKFAKLEE
ncbi:hypothetical protein FDP41_001371 [Naegleria fowleri]|uniref:Dihydroorotate dehydrogenase (quinone), mitochondrial n=1 Tax=Naegleria fowleri TaxID=5763 RepID=A0A6A5BNW2_NAEFO|nr:uncharacterized protein FDP41_001371 [Naegleria fowleri]KAF0979703.1 hypothetical protein FDP41_001371 [Naegleria fowleri]CAG4718774.1 unnamed protein product [Naegleria fowleri]